MLMSVLIVQTHAITMAHASMTKEVLNVNVQMVGKVIHVWKVNLIQSSVNHFLDFVFMILLDLTPEFHW